MRKIFCGLFGLRALSEVGYVFIFFDTFFMSYMQNCTILAGKEKKHEIRWKDVTWTEKEPVAKH